MDDPSKLEIQAGRNFRDYQPLIPVLGMMVLGILMDSFFFSLETPVGTFSATVWFWFGILLLCFGFWEKYFYEERLRYVFFLGSVVALGGIYHHAYWNFYPSNEIGFRVQDTFSIECLEGKVAGPPQFSRVQGGMFVSTDDPEKEIVTVFHFHVRARRTVHGWEKASGKLLVRTVGRLKDVHSGDLLRVKGSLTGISEAMNPHAFSPKIYYRQQRILAVLRVPSTGNVQLVRRPRVWGLWRTVEALRTSAYKQMEEFLTDETRAMASALILGCREEVSDESLNEMLEIGTIHIMAISGLHVGLLAGGFFLFCRLLGLKPFGTASLSLFAVWLYVLVSGGRPPAVRAGIIVTIAIVAYLLNRRDSHINSLAAAGILILILNPTALFSTGTQLSFLAVASLMVTPSLYEPRRNHVQNGVQEGTEDQKIEAAWEYLLVPNAPRGAILRALARKWSLGFVNLMYASFQMTVVLLPLVVKAFHVAAFIGIFMNLLLWLPLMIGMMSGAGVVLFGPIPVVGPFFGWLCSESLGAMAAIIHWGSTLPGHCLWLRGTPAFWNFLLYSLLALWIVFPALRLRSRGKFAMLLLFLVLLLIPWMQFGTSRKGELRCSFISVSHGLSILLQLPNGETILYDAGQFAPSAYPSRTISEFLWNAGVRRLDAIVVSHPDMDHYNAMPGILSRFPVGKIFVSPQMFAMMNDLNPPLSGEVATKSDLKPPLAGEVATESPEGVRGSGLNLTPQSSVSLKVGRSETVEIQTAKMLRNLRRSISARKVPIVTISAGDRIPVTEECSISVLHPTHACLEAEQDRTNANSLVLLVEYQGVKFLLTGDLAPPGLGYVLSGPPVQCDVVLAPHHGGKTCATREFGLWSQPKYFVICESFNNEQKLTTDLYRSLGARVFHTGRDGAVIFSVRDGKLGVVTREEWKEWH